MNHENHPQFSQLSIILIFICSLMLTACEIDNTDKTDEHRYHKRQQLATHAHLHQQRMGDTSRLF